MKGRPYLNRVVLEKEEGDVVKNMKKAGLLLPDTINKGKFDPARGTVIQAGDGCEEAVKNHVGKKVLYAKYAGSGIKIDGKDYFICNDEDILYLEENEDGK